MKALSQSETTSWAALSERRCSTLEKNNRKSNAESIMDVLYWTSVTPNQQDEDKSTVTRYRGASHHHGDRPRITPPSILTAPSRNNCKHPTDLKEEPSIYRGSAIEPGRAPDGDDTESSGDE